VEPVRAELIPGFYEVKNSALKAGAMGCSISGSGPSMFAVASSIASAKSVGAVMARTLLRVANLTSDVYVSRVNMDGVQVLRAKNG
jgi:homoserine kinase